VGCGKVTVTVTLWVVDPPGPTQVTAYTVVAVGVTVLLSAVFLEGVHVASHEVASVVVQEIVVFCPFVTDEGIAVNIRTGGGGNTTEVCEHTTRQLKVTNLICPMLDTSIVEL